MKIKSLEQQRQIEARAFGVVLSVGSLSTTAFCGPPLASSCTDEVPVLSFVVDSTKRAEEPGKRDEVLETLTCLCRREDLGPFGSRAAVAGIFHIAEGEASVRSHLIEIIEDPQTSQSVHHIALELLVYVADKEVQNRVLAHLKANWPNSRWGDYFDFFREVGDVEFLKWLEEESVIRGVIEMPDWFLRTQARYIRIQQNVDDLLAYLRSDDEELDRAWVARQASRHGATREEIREAIFTSFEDARDQKIPLTRNSGLVLQCDEFGVFEREDADRFPEIERARVARKALSIEDPYWPPWALLTIQKRKARFYKVARMVQDTK
ncbi:MAG: hypothetical protein JSU63_03790 [Phycisphaerales bacterium]|nr:MAG: hypothetical protein JSU63_03790 [Phycisphaerales bacterium]